MRARVFFAGLGPDNFRNLIAKSKLLDKLKGRVAVKLHMGEAYSKYTIAPEYVAVALSELKARGAKPFLTDTTALYRGTRSTERDYLSTARARGYASLGVPIVIADGDGDLDVSTDGVPVARKIAEANSMLVLTHCKGHACAGFGGAIKNIAMGCTSKAGKRAMHDFPRPVFSKEKCTGCGNCVKSCPGSAITFSESKKPNVDERACFSCGACLRACKFGAVSFPGIDDDPARVLQERLADVVGAVVKSLNGNITYVNFLSNITKYCDCSRPSEIVAPDVGILASDDPVAIDAASYSLIGSALEKATGIDGSVQIKRAERLGLGSRNYELVTV